MVNWSGILTRRVDSEGINWKFCIKFEKSKKKFLRILYSLCVSAVEENSAK